MCFKILCFWDASIKEICVSPRRIVKTILWLCSLWPSNVYCRFSKLESILQGYKMRTIFVVGKCSLPENWQLSRLCCQILLLSIKWEHKQMYWNSEHSDCISHPNTHTQTHTQTHIIYPHIYSDIISLILEEFSVSAIWRYR